MDYIVTASSYEDHPKYTSQLNNMFDNTNNYLTAELLAIISHRMVTFIVYGRNLDNKKQATKT